MGETTHKRSGELTRGVFSILLDEPEGLPAREIFPRLEKACPPTPFEQETYPSRPDDRRYESIVYFVTITSVKAGWLERKGGCWRLTEAGRHAYRSTTDPEELYRMSWDEYRKWKEGQPSQGTETGDDDKPDDSVMPSVTLKQSKEVAWTEVKNYLAEIPPYSFQEIVAGLLEGMGHHIESIADPGRDGGIDIHAVSGGVISIRIKVQVKRRQDSLSVKHIRELVGTLREGDTGLFVSTGRFTRDAHKEAEERHIVLIDGKEFFNLWVSHYKKIPEKRRCLLPIKLVAFLDLQSLPGV